MNADNSISNYSLINNTNNYKKLKKLYTKKLTSYSTLTIFYWNEVIQAN